MIAKEIRNEVQGHQRMKSEDQFIQQQVSRPPPLEIHPADANPGDSAGQMDAILIHHHNQRQSIQLQWQLRETTEFQDQSCNF